MKELRSETLTLLGDAAKTFPGGERHITTLHRYRLRGVGDIRLECLRLGGRWYTTTEAIDRFIVRLNPVPTEANSPAANLAGSTGVADVEKRLDGLGL